MADFEIHCPYHGTTEKLSLPDTYRNSGFEGEVTCAKSDMSRHFPLRIKITGGHLIMLERAK